MTLFTVGFTQKSARRFFTLLHDSGVRRVIDVRLNNVSQLAGFSKRDDLAYFLEAICDIAYVHEPLLAPTQEMLDGYRKGKGAWTEYARAFTDLITARRIEDHVPREILDRGCLLCSEDTADHCHRRLVAEYLAAHVAGLEVEHLR
ncbi:MAG: DUF488 family protein [Capsulimonadaceae bacterium]